MRNQNDNKNHLTKLKKYCNNILLKKYNISSNELNKKIISNMIYNEKLHVVSCFKEFLIFYDPAEFLSDFYFLKESKKCIKTYSEFYSLNSRIFPNYILLSESKYIFNNIKKKQRLLDIIEDNKNNMNYNKENSQKLEINQCEINNEYSLHINDSENFNYCTIFTPSIVNSIKKDFDTSNISNISKIISIIDNINKFQKNKKGNSSIFKTPKNKKQIMNEFRSKKKNILSMQILTIDRIKNNSNKISKKESKIIPKRKKKNEKEKILKKNKEKIIDVEISNKDFKKNYKNPKNKESKRSENNIHKKTQSNENIRNDIKIFKDDTLNNKFSMLLKTNCDIKSIKSNYDNNIIKKNNNLQKYIHQIASISKVLENKKNNPINNKTSIKNSKNSLKKSTISKANTTYTNKTQIQPIISHRHKKVSTITKSMPKLPTSFEKQIIIKNTKNIFHKQLFYLPIYNPFSIMQCLKKADISNYWYDSGSPSFIVDYMKQHGIQDPAEYAHLEVAKDFTSSREIEHATPESFLYQSGYLSIEERREDILVLKYPNYEVRKSLIRMYLDEVYNVKNYITVGKKLWQALSDGNLEEVIKLYNAALASVPYSDFTRQDEALYRSLFLMLLRGAGVTAHGEVPTNLGRSDVLVYFPKRVIILELKLARKKSEIGRLRKEGMKQIEAKGYAKPYDVEERAVTYAVIVIDGEQHEAVL